MCQVTDGAAEELEKTPSLRTGRDCMKCGAQAVVVARIKDALCRECFMTYFTHRFRATIGKAMLIRDGDKVLVAVSGGNNSCAMLHLIKQGLSVAVQKKLRFVPALIYIDEGAVIGQTQKERMANQKTVCKYFIDSGFTWHTAALEEVFGTSTSDNPSEFVSSNCHVDTHDQSSEVITDRLDGLTTEDGRTDRLEKLLAQTKSLTAKQDLVQRLRNELLLRLAKQHGYCKVMLGNTSTSLSVSLLSNIAQGRGAAVSLDIGFADNRHGGIIFVRPMRELTNREVALYNRLCSVESTFAPNLATKAGSYSSISTLTETFINGLQADFPSTVSTVFRTGEKLTVSSDSEGTYKDKCAMCMAQLDTKAIKSSALSATQFSLTLTSSKVVCNQLASQTNPGGDVSNSGCCDSTNLSGCCGSGGGSGHSTTKSELPTRKQLESCLCYGCRLTVKDVVNVYLLPVYILEEVARRKRRTQMRDEIQEFLLEET